MAVLTDIEDSRERVLATAGTGRLEPTILARVAAARTIAAWTLAPAPADPVAHVAAAHVQSRPHLVRLREHAADREVPSVMTAELFALLTNSPPPTGPDRRYTYTPRKVLRRVLDHGLDHLNQIDQWLAWQRHGLAPTPTDGWASSTVTLGEDRLPLTGADFDAWLWRIDQGARLLVQRAAGLSQAELDWAPPDGGWPLRRVLHHVARSEVCTRRRSTRRCPTSRWPAMRRPVAASRSGSTPRTPPVPILPRSTSRSTGWSPVRPR